MNVPTLLPNHALDAADSAAIEPGAAAGCKFQLQTDTIDNVLRLP